MKNKQTGLRKRAGIGLPAIAVIALAGVCAVPWSDSRAQVTAPAIGFHVVSAGGKSLHNSCFRLAGTTGQAAPGYSSNPADSLIAGFWAVAPTTGLDEIFFNGFEDC